MKQHHLLRLSLDLLHERTDDTEQRLCPLEALVSQILELVHAPEQTTLAHLPVPSPPPERRLLPAEGLDPSAAERVFGYRQATITNWLTRAGEHAQILHDRSFRHLWLPPLQLDELRTRLRCAKEVLWLWLAIDPLTKIIPVLHLGSRTQKMAHLLIHSLRQILTSDCLPLFTSDGLNLYFYAPLSPLWTVARSGATRTENTSMAGSGEPDLRSGKEKLPAAQAGAGLSCDAPRNKRSSPGCLARTRLFRVAERLFYI